MPRSMRVDLHTHSTASDGTDEPADLPRLAQQAGLAGFALTDHDTTAGLASAAAAAQQAGIRFVPGIELSVHADPFAIESPDPHEQPTAGSLHLLGYFIRTDSPQLKQIQEHLCQARATRNPQILDKLRKLGVNISEEEVLQAAGVGDDLSSHSVGRPHIAQVLLHKGYVKSMHEAFVRYLGPGAAAYTPRELPIARQAIDALHAAGGVCVLAHPVHLGLSPADLEHTIAKLADLGLDGIETHHSDHEVADVRRLTALAERFDLIATGGSDYHGSRKAIALGSVVSPVEALERLEEAATRYR